MRQPLGRIEREYVVGELARTLPSFELTSDTGGLGLLVREYSLREGAVTFPYPVSGRSKKGIERPSVVRARFQHKKRYMSFLAELRFHADTASFTISQDIVPDDDETETSDERLVLSLSGTTVSCDSLPGKGDLSYTVDPADDGRMAVLAEKIGLSSKNQAARERLFVFVRSVREDSLTLPREPGKGLCLFLDHDLALVAIPVGDAEGTNGSYPDADTPVPVTVRIGMRTIRFAAKILGYLKITRSVVIIAFDCSSAHEEDKRILFERYYGTLYA